MVKRSERDSLRLSHTDREHSLHMLRIEEADSVLSQGNSIDEGRLAELKEFLVKSKPVDLTQISSHSHSLTYIELLFPILYQSLQNASGLGQFRILCCDTLSVWLLRASQAGLLDRNLKSKLDHLVSNEVATFLFEYVIDFLDQSGAPLSNSLKDMLTKLIGYLRKNRSEDERERLFQKWLDLNFSLSYTTRTIYSIAEVLFKELKNDQYALQNHPTFPDKCISIMWSNALANSSGKALTTMYRQIYNSWKKQKIENYESKWLSLWEEPVKQGLNDVSLRKNMQVYLLPLLFKISPIACKNFVKSLVLLTQDTSDDKVDLMIGSLRVAQDLAILEEPFHGDNAVISIDYLHRLLTHHSEQFRIGSYALLTSSPRGSNPIQPYIYKIVQDVTDIFYVESDLQVRNDYYSLTKQFITRVRDSAYALDRNYSKLIKKENFEEANLVLQRIKSAKNFMEWQLHFLYDQIRPGAPYQKLNLGFKMLLVLIRSGLDNRVDKKFYDKQHLDFPFNIQIYNSKIIRLLIDNITNDFEDIREQSVQILLICPVEVLAEYLSSEQISNIMIKATEMLSDVKGRRGDGGARIVQFIFQYFNFMGKEQEALELIQNLIESLLGSLAFAERDLTTAVYQQSVHGYFTTLRLIFEIIDLENQSSGDFIDLFKLQITCIIKETIFIVWNIVKPILIHDSLEGSLPEGIEAMQDTELEAKYGPASQIILSYSWRAVKESTSLLGVLLDRCPEALLSDELTLESGAVILEQLASVRHRGAFSSVYPTFISCCERCNRSKSSKLQEQPLKWLEHNISLIKNTTQYISRRSGGLPFSTTAILIADKSKSHGLMKFAVAQLLSIAREPYAYDGEEKMDIPQVHAFNCIKHIFIESQLSDSSALFVNDALKLSLANFSCDAWAIRNCAVMLFTALQNRLFGTKKLGDILPTVSSRLFFSKYEGVKEILLQNLMLSVDGSLVKDGSIEALFPVLTVLSRLECTSEDSELEDFIPLLMICLNTSHWKIRETAARALASIIYSERISDTCYEIINGCSTRNQNSLHGSLLAVRELVAKTEERLFNYRISPEVLLALFGKINELLVYNNCYSTAKVYVSLLSSLNDLSTDKLPVNVVQIFERFFVSELTRDFADLNGSRQLLLVDISELLFETYLPERDLEKLSDIIELCLLSNMFEVQLSAVRWCSTNLQMLNSELLLKVKTILWEIIQDTSSWSHVASTSLSLLQKLSHSDGQIQDTKELNSKIDSLFRFTDLGYSEDIRSTSLEVLGPFIANMVIHQQNDSKIVRYLQLTENYGGDGMPFQVRLSSIKSLASFTSILYSHGDKSVYCAKGYLNIYEAIDDDDEDIRFSSTKSLSNLLGLNYTTVPAYMSHLFSRKFISEFPSGTGWSIVYDKLVERNKNFKPRLQTSLNGNKELFTVERENLYLDTVSYNQFMNKLVLSAKDNISDSEITTICHSSIEELDLIISIILENGNDGYVGWTKEEDSFSPIIEALGKIEMLKSLNNGNLDPRLVIKLKNFQELCFRFNLHELIHSAMMRVIT